ncbi:MAG: BamA/TamA family outer membrane protein [Saprospiraceae bacterium]
MNIKNRHIKNIFKYYPFILLVIFLPSCAINKYLPENKILLTKNSVILKKSELTRKQVDRDRIRYVVPNPHYGLAKGNLYFYFKHSDPDDTTAWDRFFIKKLSEKPMWYSEEDAEQGKNDLIKHLNASGYYQGEVSYEVKLDGKKAKVIYTVAAGKPLRIKSIEYYSQNSTIQHLLDSLKPSLKLQPGEPLDEQLLIPDQAKLIQTIQDAGFYQVNKSNFDYYYEDSTGQNIILKCDVLPQVGQDEMKKYTISGVNVYTVDRLSSTQFGSDTVLDKIHYRNGYKNQALKPTILKKYLQFAPGDLYSLSALQRTRNTFQNLGIYRSVSVLPEIIGDDSLNLNIFLPPVKRQYVQADLEGSYVTNKDQAAGNKLFEVRLALQYRHRNVFKGAEQFTVTVVPNIGLQLVKGKLLVPWGLNLQTSLTIPRFIEIGFVKFARNLNLISSKFYNEIKNGSRTRFGIGSVYDLFYYYNLNNGNSERSVQRETKINFGYEYTKDNRIFFRFNPIGFDYLNYDLSQGFSDVAPPFLLKSFEDRLLAGVFLKEISADINNQYLNSNVSRILLGFESSGIETGIADLFTKKTVIPRISRFLRFEGDGRYTWRLSSKDQIGVRLATGIALPFGSGDNSIPFVRQFYVGGPNSIRGWAIREIGPGAVKNEQSNGNRFSFFQTGNFKLEFGSEYRFDIFSVFKGAILLDGGNVWLLKKDPLQLGGELSTKFLSQMYLSSGLGLRLDFNFFLFRFDTGIKLRTPYLNERGNHLYRTTKLNDLQFNLSLGLPF